jgi:hypothetical protein
MFRTIISAALLLLGIANSIDAQDKIVPENSAQEKSALEKNPSGWIDIFPDQELKNWKRVGLEQGLVKKHPWSVHGDTLLCEGVGAKEMFLFDSPLGDGSFHLEWRFKQVDGKQEYNSGAYVRTLDGKVWHQIQIAHLEKPPFMGDLFCDMTVNGKTERVIAQGNGTSRVKPPGQSNTYEITAKGKEIEVWINGATTLTWRDCAVEKGLIGMQAEFFTIEFRNLKFKPL